ncbi:hypothetical protein L6164_026310 [Bauhinia variegata]|uniref:Uncharacterized protein n=1 Tax=Bauhinia variegata TaxID=167791 RepID=A0ACB9LQH4_BAUVA|nr:hypothetical protein L6164_026310 [Bauhinia variegata]
MFGKKEDAKGEESKISNNNWDKWKHGGIIRGAARTQAPTTTNYDVGSTNWVVLRLAPFRSAMKVTILGYEPA